MGCYDSVRFRCPNCNERFLEHSKAGKCNLKDYDSQAVPLRIAADLDGVRVTCPHCSTEFVMQSRMPTRVEVYLARVDEDSDDE